MLQVQSFRRCQLTILFPFRKQQNSSLTRSQRKSITPSNSHKVSAYLHRIGYHFHSGIFDEACNVLGYRSRGGKLVRESDEPNSGFARVMARYGAQFDELSERQPMANEEIKVKKAIRELFPRIPDHSLNDIFQTAWKEVRKFTLVKYAH